MLNICTKVAKVQNFVGFIGASKPPFVRILFIVGEKAENQYRKTHESGNPGLIDQLSC